MQNALQLETRTAVVDLRDADRAGVQADALAEVRPSGEVVAFRRAADYGLLALKNVWKVTRLDRDWMAAYRYVVQAGTLVVGEVRIYPRETPPTPGRAWWSPGEWSGTLTGHSAAVPAGGLTSRTARLGALIRARLVDAQRVVRWARGEVEMARQAGLTRSADPFGEDGMWGEWGLKEDGRPALDPRGRFGRQAEAAREYVAAIQRGDRAVLVAVQRRLKVNYATARDLIHQARANDLLLPKRATVGRAEGYLTDRAQELLRKRGKGEKRRDG
jgi:hypothetical protein